MLSMQKPLFEEFVHGFRVTLFKEKINGGVNGGVNELLSFIENNPDLRAKEISQTLGTPLRTIERQIKKLKDDGKIKFSGSPKTGGYSII